MGDIIENYPCRLWRPKFRQFSTKNGDATHHWGASPAGYMIWQLFLAGFQPFVTSLSTLGKCRGDGAEEFAVCCAEVVHYPTYASASVG